MVDFLRSCAMQSPRIVSFPMTAKCYWIKITLVWGFHFFSTRDGAYSKLHWHFLHKIVMHIHVRHNEILPVNFTHARRCL